MEAGLVTDFLKLRILRSGDCFTENTKNSPNPVTTNSSICFFVWSRQTAAEGRRGERATLKRPALLGHAKD